MSRYIDAEKISYFVGARMQILAHKEVIDEVPTADVEEVRHGKWEHGREIGREYIGDALLAICYDKWWCSQCHYTIDDHHYSKITYKRCPECGAKMDKEREE